MYEKLKIDEIEIPHLEEKLIEYSKTFEIACILNSHSQALNAENNLAFSEYDLIGGFSRKVETTKIIDNINGLDQLSGPLNDWYLGFLTYDLKNNFEELHSHHPDFINWPPMFFFIPEILVLKKDSELTIHFNPSIIPNFNLIAELKNVFPELKQQPVISFNSRISKKDYIEKISQIKNHISRGDIYEVNFCQEFYSNTIIDPYSVYQSLSANIASPFSVFFKIQDKFLLSASPERFLKKKDLFIVSQPIKGTSERSNEPDIDYENKIFLTQNVKEQSENIMIVDLVRNDLSRIAKKGSVKVEELCGVYSFPHVHQMISTISAQLKTISFKEIIKATFPMGSMTGAPKIEAMKIIEKYETIKRGLYSGSIGYITPAGDFDLNVVIRSIQYNSENQYVSYIAGSAVTGLSDPEKEYQECLLKTYGINQALHLKNNAE